MASFMISSIQQLLQSPVPADKPRPPPPPGPSTMMIAGEEDVTMLCSPPPPHLTVLIPLGAVLGALKTLGNLLRFRPAENGLLQVSVMHIFAGCVCCCCIMLFSFLAGDAAMSSSTSDSFCQTRRLTQHLMIPLQHQQQLKSRSSEAEVYITRELLDDSFPCWKLSNFTSKKRLQT